MPSCGCFCPLRELRWSICYLHLNNLRSCTTMFKYYFLYLRLSGCGLFLQKKCSKAGTRSQVLRFFVKLHQIALVHFCLWYFEKQSLTQKSGKFQVWITRRNVKMNQSSFVLHLSVKIFFKVPILGNCAGILSLIFASLLHCYEKIGLINQTSNLGSLQFRLYGRFCLQQNDSCTKCLTDATKLIFWLLKFEPK